MCNVSNFGEYQTADMFERIGHKRDGFILVDHFEATGRENFAEVTDATKADVLNLISKDKLISPENIAKVLGVKREWVARQIAELIQAGALVQKVNVIDGVEQIERGRTPQAEDILKKLPPPKTTEILLRYSYQKRPIAEGAPIISTTRPFCRKLMELSNEGRVYTRGEIEKVSARVGYSVFERAGGFWFHDGEADPQCRHYWRTEILLKKSK